MTSLAQPRLKLMGAPREVKPGVYHVTDLLRRPARTIAAWHLGEEAPSGIDGWLAARGSGLEDPALDVMGIPDGCRQPEIYLDLEDGAAVTGHPDYVCGLVEDEPPQAIHPLHEDDYDLLEMGEAKSQLGTDDPARRDLAVEQALTYIGLLAMGADLYLDGVPMGGPVSIGQVRPVMAGLYDLDDSEPEPVNADAARSLAEYIAEKARVVHEAVQEQDLSISEAFDAERPPRIEDTQGPPPVAEGEEAEIADETILAKVAMDHLEDTYDGGRERFEETWREAWRDAGEPCLSEADLETRLAAPCGARLQLWTQTETVVHESSTLEQLEDKRDELEHKLEQVKQQAIEEVLEENSELVAELDQVENELAEEREACTETRKVPHYVRCVGHGDLDPRDALKQLVDGDGGA